MHNPAISGLQNVNFAQRDGHEGYDTQPAEGLQAHHNRELHWSASSSVGGKVRYFDSMYKEPNGHVTKQMFDLYAGADEQPVEVSVMPQQRQHLGIQCGDFVAATFFEIALGADPDSLAAVQWDQDKMRTHLKRCLEEGKVLAFPRLEGQKASRVIPHPIVYSLKKGGEFTAAEKKKASAKRKQPMEETDSEPDAKASAPPVLHQSARGRTSKPSAKALQLKGFQTVTQFFTDKAAEAAKSKRQKTEHSSSSSGGPMIE